MKKVIFFGVFFLAACLDSSAQQKNPFDLERKGTAVIVPVEIEEDPEEEVVEVVNPFSVSHIPIRKNQLKEIEELTKADRTDQATMSLSSLPLWVIIASMCILAFVLYTKPDHVLNLLKSLANENMMKLSNYEEKGGRNLIYTLGYGIFLLNVALILYLLATRQFTVESDYLYFLILGGCAVFFLGKHLMNSLFSWIMRFEKESKLYDFTIITIYNLIGMFFLILNVLMVFGPVGWFKVIAVIAMVIYVIGLLSRYYKSIRIGQFQLNNHFMHFFLYFCAFEFSPWVILYTALTDAF